MKKSPLVPLEAALVLLVSIGTPAYASDDFEKFVRPVLVEKCQSCHGPTKARGGFRLDSREALLRGGDSGPAVVPGKPAASLLIKAIGYTGDLKMPPKAKLSIKEIEHLTRWVAQGARWPNHLGSTGNTTTKFTVSSKQRRWWAFQSVRPPTVPPVRNLTWARTPIDRFILAELEKHHLAPADESDRRTLLRRVTYDLTGLPPTPQEVDDFLHDDSPDAYSRVVDRLLASPNYGPRWARHWLDVVRYADYHDGNPAARTSSCEPLNAWRYRDWVVRAFNADMAFDRFIVHQIAGDLLPVPDGADFYEDGLVATTFLTNGSWDRGDADKEKMVSDMVDDQIDTIGKAFMGLTLGCARCHDHKFDPISQADYYGLAGIFYSTRILNELGAKGGEYTLQRIPLASKAYLTKRHDQLGRIANLNKQLTDLDRKTPKPGPKDPARLTLLAKRTALQRELLPEPPVAEAAQDGGTPGGLFPKIQDVPIHIRGSYTRLGGVAARGMPQFFAGTEQPKIAVGSGRRELGKWVASRENPLTARVIVNRVWQWHFGQGLVRTPNNFGLLSEPPSHPELLDYLASTFMREGWSLKKLHRRILLSAVYRQSSLVSEERLNRDPENRLIGRFTPRRLEAEAVRDAMLTVAGRLETAQGGPATHDLNVPRRSIYVQTARWDRSNYATLFDAANPDASVERRDVSTVAPQALFLLNHDFVQTQAKHLADRVRREVPGEESARIQHLFRLTFGRKPTSDEISIASRLLQASKGSEPAWRDLAHVVLCSNEFIYLD